MSKPSHTQYSTDLSLADQLLHIILGIVNTQAIFVVAKLGIADLLKDGPKSVEELANATQTHAPTLYRILRALANQGIFVETETCQFTLSPLAELLKTSAPFSLRNYAILDGSGYRFQAWSNLLQSVQTGEPAIKHAYGMNSFEYYQQHPEDSKVFNEAMTSLSKMDVTAVCDAFDFSNFHTIVDVGGGHGYLLAGILKDHPSLNGVLFDLPSVVKGAHGFIQDEGLSDRCQIAGGDFLKEVPKGGDVYILKRVLSAFEDKSSEKILENCRDAMVPDGRLLIVDANVNSPYGNLYDIMLLAFPGGRMRTEAENRDLLSRVGFNLSRVVPTNSYLSIIEGVPA